MKETFIKARLAGHAQVYHDAVAETAARVREERIIPLCRRHACSFMSGNGTFFFSRGESMWSDPLDPDDVPPGIRAILRVLNAETLDGPLGFYVDDYYPEGAHATE